MYFLKIGSKEFQIGHEALSSLASSIPDHPDNLELITELAKHPSAVVRRQVASKSKLSESALTELSKDKDHDVIKNLFYSDAFKKFANIELMKHFIELNDIEILRSIASNFESFDNCDPSELLNILISHPDPYVRLNIAQNWSTPKKLLKTLRTDSDADVRIAAHRDS